MSGKRQMIKIQVRNLLRSKWLIAYAAFFLLATDGLVRFLGSDAKTILSLMNILITIVPLVCLIFGGIHIYNSREFIELLASQPLRRSTIFSALYLSVAGALSLCMVVGTLIPLAYHRVLNLPAVWFLIAYAVALTFIFTAIALWITMRYDDKARGIGLAISVWLVLTVLYDGIILLLVYYFSDYPLEMGIAAVTMLNPVDLVRIHVMMQLDVSALMGYTGAVFQRLLGASFGQTMLFAVTALWIVLPYVSGRRVFLRKDF